MSSQAQHLADITLLSAQLDEIDGKQATKVLERIDGLVHEAARENEVRTPQEAAAALGIALHALGADPARPRPEECLIQLASAFLATLVTAFTISEDVVAPCIGGLGIIVSRMTGVA